jgi:hypothetical protein
MPSRSAPERLQVDALLDSARGATGLTDFGDPWFLAPLDALVEFVNRDVGPLTPNDRRRGLIVGCLADRLKLVDHLQRHPSIHEERLDVAGIIIVGRGGSTLLQRLLATSVQLTSTQFWELTAPVPERDEAPGDNASRIAQGQARIDSMYEATPELKGMHPLDVRSYDEEILLLERSFLSLMYWSYFNLPDYMSWSRMQDHSRAYRELTLWLKVLQAQAPERRGRRWLLKSVHHLLGGGLRSLLATFPDATIIMTHRDLGDVIASSCSGQSMLLRNFGNRVDDAELGPRWIRLYRDAMEEMMKIRGELPAERFLDFQFRELVAAPLTHFSVAMERMGLRVTQADEKAAAEWMADHTRDKHPPHKYRMEDYGLTAAMIENELGFYHEAFVR